MKLLISLLVIFLSIAFFYRKNIESPKDITYPVSIVYNENESIYSFSTNLKKQGIIQSPKLFRLILSSLGYDKKIKPNEYTFLKAQNVFLVASQIGQDASQAKGIKVIIPEGSTVLEIKRIISSSFPKLTDIDIILNTQEGYLFPDTYFFSINSTTFSILEKLRDTHTRKTLLLKQEAQRQNKKWEDIVIMASLLEKEGKTKDERKVISGILWKRLSIGMPLQVDATFLYTIQKGSKNLSLSDLQTDSPYNTYTRTGLPIGPINNPGLETLEAALYPEASPYLFYLHDSSGFIHYGKNFDEHKINKAKYLY